MANASAEVIHTRQRKMKIAWSVSEKEDILFHVYKKSHAEMTIGKSRGRRSGKVKDNQNHQIEQEG